MKHVRRAWCAIAIGALGVGCFASGDRMPAAGAGDYKAVALEFTKALASRDYAAAYALTSTEYQARTTLHEMREAFEAIVPTDWKTVGPVETGHTMESWPDKRPSDVGWVYVSVGGDISSEAVTVVVTLDGDALRVRSVEFGRP